ncbi:MAG TPA: bifunctional [glutamine synthetase] adenylyltransferase/[glutamine synthetase]-adenylyl-L-tyrosine phosphorylase [Dongiaceae bacterium]|nr:bifunctional [glutamine synthetase] adenylyltransferase/[glutamine synthetase]-adenylyl-L-tyrosine phosphorylase [Dongiaceae bacterium]
MLPLSLPLPQASDRRQADLGRQQFLENIAADQVEQLPEHTAALLDAIFGNSPYLGHCLLAESTLFLQVLTNGPDAVFSKVLKRLEEEIAVTLDDRVAMHLLRRAKRQSALLIATADIARGWSLEQVTAALSDLAETALQATIGLLLRQLHEKGEIALPDPTLPMVDSGLIVLALGKLGARELNYSSDIDLMILFDPDKVDYRGRKTVQECFVRLARNLVRLLQDVTEDGYVFRTDLRLRPDPGSTPLAISTLAAETYYEGMGQNWERAAMIKARVVAGDVISGAEFLRNLRPFIWRKHLDFAAIQDIHSIKRQIHAVKGHREVAVAGHNIKVGRGGIREIEFFAQTQQLIWGGRQPELRVSPTCDAIDVLVRLGRTRPEVAADLLTAYRYLRHVEHRLQMIADQQTQTLPEVGPGLDRLALFCGHRDTAEFSQTLLHHLGQVEDHYAELFEEAPSLGSAGGKEAGNLVFTGTEDDPETVKTLQRMGFRDGADVSALIRAWHHGRYRATRSARARELLTELMPQLLDQLAKTADPDMAFRRFDAFLRGLPAGVQLFSLLHLNRSLLSLVAEVMGSAPLLADQVSRAPALLDNVLSAGFFEAVPQAEDLRSDLARQLALANDFQDSLDILRRWAQDRRFQVGVRLLHSAAHIDEAAGSLSDIADTVIAALLPLVEQEFARQHGRLPGNGMAVVALGRLGSREMTVTSDLDLVFIYDIPGDIPDWETIGSDGAKPLPPIQYYARLAQRFINAVTALTGEGKLYDVDMRLRPSGNSGPIASGLPAFEKYQSEEAWTWEHMALTRARVIAGAPALQKRLAAALRRVLARRRDIPKLRADILDMRQRIAQQYRSDDLWDLKYYRGGQVDIDFAAQFLQLRYAPDYPGILQRSPAASLAAAAEAGLLRRDIAAELIEVGRYWTRLQQMIRLLVGGRIDETKLPLPTRQHLAEIGGCADFAALRREIERRAAVAFRHVTSLLSGEAG